MEAGSATENSFILDEVDACFMQLGGVMTEEMENGLAAKSVVLERVKWDTSLLGNACSVTCSVYSPIY